MIKQTDPRHSISVTGYQRTFRRAVRRHKSLRVALWVLAGVAALGAVLVWLGPVAWWVGGSTVSGLHGQARADAIASVRQQLLAAAAGLGAAVGLLYTARTYRLSKSGQVTDRFSQAIEHLGSDQSAQRTGGIYALERIMRDSPRDQQTVVEVLDRNAATPWRTSDPARQPGRHPREPSPRTPSMAQLRGQKPADGADTLAIAQIRWQRTTMITTNDSCRNSAVL